MARRIDNIYKKASDPQFQIKWIYEHFHQNVPFVSKPPTLEEFGLPPNVKDLLRKESDKVDLHISLLLLLLYAIGFAVTVRLFLNNPDYQGSIWKALGAALGSYGWMAFIGFEILFSGTVNKIADKKKHSTPLYQAYDKFTDATLAYRYWSETVKLDFWMSLDGHSFEDEVAAVFRREGYSATVSRHGGDGGIDIVLKRGNESIAVQCKAHKIPIGPSVARDLFGTMIHWGYSKGMIVSRSGFTSGVYEFVKDKPISLVNLGDLMRLQNPHLLLTTIARSEPKKSIPTGASQSPTVTSSPVSVKSSFIQNITYQNTVLSLTFKGGSTYRYYSVPESVYKEMLSAPSKGKFFHERIKDQYPYL